MRTSLLMVNEAVTLKKKEVNPHQMINGSDRESNAFSKIDNDGNEIPIMPLFHQYAFYKNEVFSVTPGEGQKPLSIFKDPNASYLAFSTLLRTKASTK